MLWTTYIITTKSATDLCATPSKAKKSYPEVIADAFRSEPSHRMAVQQIHEYIFNTYPEMKERATQVRSNIRYHMSACCLFVSGDRVSAQGKACYNLFHPLIERRDLQGQTRTRGYPCGVQLDENIICQNRYN